MVMVIEQKTKVKYVCQTHRFERSLSDCYVNDFEKYGKNTKGLYFLYDNNELVYIGKSKNLIHRIMESAADKFADSYRYALIENEADMHIYEPYYVSIYNPTRNSQFRTKHLPTFNLPELEISDLKPILASGKKFPVGGERWR